MPALDSTDPAADDVVALLRTGDLVIEGRMPWSSNATFLCEVHEPGRRPDGGLPADDEETRRFLEEAGFGPDGAYRDRLVAPPEGTLREVRLRCGLVER